MSGNNGSEGTPQERTLSRIGRKPIPIPTGVEVQVGHGEVTVTGPRGTFTQKYHPDVTVRVEDGVVLVGRVSRSNYHHALHGLARSLISNAITGVNEGYTKTLELMGVGYRVQAADEGIVLSVGYSHPVPISPEPGVTMEVEGTSRKSVTWRPNPQGQTSQRVQGKGDPLPGRGATLQTRQSCRPEGLVMAKDKNARRLRIVRHIRVRKKVRGTAERPRLCVFRSLRHIYAQIIDDTQGNTLAAATSLEAENQQSAAAGSKLALSEAVGKLVAERAKAKGITQVVFDRGGYKYHGRIKALADGSREGGLAF